MPLDTGSTEQAPLISVVMGAYCAENTLRQALDSILNQTVKDWEFIICDDGSTDSTADILCEYAEKDPRIRILTNAQNRGLPYTLNRGLAASRGKYIARMDADDFSEPDRFEKELAVLESRPEISIVGSQVALFDDSGVWGVVKYPLEPVPDDLKNGIIFFHGSVLVRREAYEAVGGYCEEPRAVRVEDFDLWVRMYEKGIRGANIDKCLYRFRMDANAASKRIMKYRLNEAGVRIDAVKRLNLPKRNYLRAAKPILLGFLPKSLYYKLYRRHRQTDMKQ